MIVEIQLKRNDLLFFYLQGIFFFISLVFHLCRNLFVVKAQYIDSRQLLVLSQFGGEKQ